MLRVAVPPTYAAERRYVTGVVLGDFLGLEHRVEPENRSDVAVSLDGEAGELRLADGLFATPTERWLAPETVPVTSAWWTLPDDCRTPGGSESLPVLFSTGPSTGLSAAAGSIACDLDVFGAAFFMLSRYEEVAAPSRDRHERFPARSALATRAGFLERPIVDEYVQVLWRLMTRLWPRLVSRERQFRVMLTHDVDRPFSMVGQKTTRLIRQVGGDVLRHCDFSTAARRLRAASAIRRAGHTRDVSYTFPWLMEASERMGVRSTFNFIPGRTAGDIDGSYDVDDPPIRALLGDIHARGHEVGIHPSYHTFRSRDVLAREFARLRDVADSCGVVQAEWGGRQHYLRWEAPTTWRIWDEAGLEYDSTLGFADRAGFRCGTCLEFPVFDLLQRTTLRLRERPLTAMDMSLTSADYMGLGHEEALGVVGRLVAQCRRHRGDFVLLWHNSSLVRRRDKELYRSILELLA